MPETFFAISLFLFSAFNLLLTIEDFRGEKFAAQLREKLDKRALNFIKKVRDFSMHFFDRKENKFTVPNFVVRAISFLIRKIAVYTASISKFLYLTSKKMSDSQG